MKEYVWVSYDGIRVNGYFGRARLGDPGLDLEEYSNDGVLPEILVKLMHSIKLIDDDIKLSRPQLDHDHTLRKRRQDLGA